MFSPIGSFINDVCKIIQLLSIFGFHNTNYSPHPNYDMANRLFSADIIYGWAFVWRHHGGGERERAEETKLSVGCFPQSSPQKRELRRQQASHYLCSPVPYPTCMQNIRRNVIKDPSPGENVCLFACVIS